MFTVAAERTGSIDWQRGESLSCISVQLHFSFLKPSLTCGAPELGKELSKGLHTVQYENINYITKVCNYVCSCMFLLAKLESY